MSDKFFTSDTHFKHKNILKYQRDTRLGETVEEMDELIVKAWNDKVKRGDVVYHLGDFAFAQEEYVMKLLNRLNGSIHLIRGNHDRVLDNIKHWFASYQDYKTIRVGDTRIVMMHYPIESWDMKHHGTIHLHGHCHGGHHDHRLMKNRMDVGVDTRDERDMAPYHFEEVMAKINRINNQLEG